MPKIDIDTSKIYNEKYYYPNTKWRLPEKNFVKLNERYSFDLEKMKNEVNKLRTEFGFEPFKISKSGKKRMSYLGIGLTARPNAEIPLYDALDLFSKNEALDISSTFKKMASNGDIEELHEKNFSEYTPAYRGYLKETIDKFRSLKTKIRILDLKRNGIITPHVDFPYYKQIRVHAVIESNNNTWWEVAGERFQIPADGNFYWFDTGKTHAVWNDGISNRTVLSVNLSIYEDRNYNQILSENNNLIHMLEAGLV